MNSENAMLLQACLGCFSHCPHPTLPPPLASVLLEHRTLSLQRKKHTLSCPTSVLSRTLMSKLLHMDSLAWHIALGALHPITTTLSRAHAISLLKKSGSQKSCPFVKPGCHTKEKGAQYPTQQPVGHAVVTHITQYLWFSNDKYKERPVRHSLDSMLFLQYWNWATSLGTLPQNNNSIFSSVALGAK